MKTLIIGAGSIGNHLAQAARVRNWEVTVCDKDQAALDRMREDIYPARYGKWDESINLVLSEPGSLPSSEYNIIFVGTPPDSHMQIARQALGLKPKILHIEKPLGTPGDDYDEFVSECIKYPDTKVTVGYDHAVAESVSFVRNLISGGIVGDVLAIDAYTHEHWAGIFKAHPWLDGPHDSYLGYWRRGGGALGEHSHALHLGLVLAQTAGWGTLALQSSHVDLFNGAYGEEYDKASHLIFSPENSTKTLRVAQDVITKPTIKGFRVIGSVGRIDVQLAPTLDVVTYYNAEGKSDVHRFDKSRPKDFLDLMNHYDLILKGAVKYEESPIRLELGIEVMRYITETFRIYGS